MVEKCIDCGFCVEVCPKEAICIKKKLIGY
ncbi:MAG: 4Fe-4S binding protein [Methanomicrobiales archaeon]